MGMIGNFVRGAGAVTSLGQAARGLSEVFVPNATEGQSLAAAAQRAALDQLGAEFALAPRGHFDRCIDGLNRLPRPTLALGTLGLFIYAMVEPSGFAARMEGLGYVPDPLWWLLGAIVSFYFGARELHYLRAPSANATPQPPPVIAAWQNPDRPVFARAEPFGPEAEGAGDDNPALAEWTRTRSPGDGGLY
ncbi:MAG: holin family protein [Jannaschia sp.]